MCPDHSSKDPITLSSHLESMCDMDEDGEGQRLRNNFKVTQPKSSRFEPRSDSYSYPCPRSCFVPPRAAGQPTLSSRLAPMGRDTHPFLGPKDPAPQVPARTWCPTIPTQPGSSSTWFEASHLYNWETLGHPMTSLLTGKMGTDLTAWSS